MIKVAKTKINSGIEQWQAKKLDIQWLEKQCYQAQKDYPAQIKVLHELMTDLHKVQNEPGVP